MGGERKDTVQVREATSWAEQLWLTKAEVLLPFIRKEQQGKKRKKNPPIFGLNEVTTMEVLELPLKTVLEICGHPWVSRKVWH